MPSMPCGHRAERDCTPFCADYRRPNKTEPKSAPRPKSPVAIVARPVRDVGNTTTRLPIEVLRARRAADAADREGAWWGNLPHLDTPTTSPLMGEFARRRQVMLRVGYAPDKVAHVLQDKGRATLCDHALEIPKGDTVFLNCAMVRTDDARDDGKMTVRQAIPAITCETCRVRTIARLMRDGLYSGS